MTDIRENPAFAAAYRRMAQVRLNPRRHTSANGLVHSEAVAANAAALARANGLSDDHVRLLANLGRAHDIGKIMGTARPEKSLTVLADCGVTDPEFLALVKWHDTGLPWFNATRRGQGPADAAWRRLAAEVDMRLLCLFMVSDREDAPGGWRRNGPTAWFIEQARQRGLVDGLVLDVPEFPSETSAGAALVQDGHLLVIRTRAAGFELPKGGPEWDEALPDAALRELREEAGLQGAFTAGPAIGEVRYPVGDHTKRVVYFRAAGVAAEGPLPGGTRERRWVARDEVGTLPLLAESLRPVLAAALG